MACLEPLILALRRRFAKPIAVRDRAISAVCSHFPTNVDNTQLG